MSKPKGAPPPGWRPTVKGKAVGTSGDVFSNAAQGGSVRLPDGGAPIAGSRFSARGGAGQSGGESEIRELFSGDLPDYGMYRAMGVSTAGGGGGYPPSQASEQRSAGVAAKGSTHSKFFEDDSGDEQARVDPKAAAQKKDFSALFEGLEDSASDAKAKPGASSKRGPKVELPDAYPMGQNAPDYRGLFERLSQGGQTAQPEPAPEETGLFKQTHTVEEPPPAAAPPQLPRATLAGSAPTVRRGAKLILDLDSFLVDCAVDWGRERAIRSFNLCGKADEGVSKWSETMQSRGVLTVDDFRNHGVELDLSDTSVISSSYAQLEKFAGALKMDRSVTALRLSRAQLGSAGCGWLAGGMMKNRSLKELILSDNDISDEGIDALAAVLDTNTTLTLLDLSSNQVTSKGATLLADGLRRNRKLRELNLGFNEVGDTGAVCLAEAVDPASTSTSVLRTLNLEGNNSLGKEGCARLAESFHKKGTFLETLHLPDEVLSTKREPETRRKEPERFVVVCSETGVDIRAAGRRKEQVTWLQEAEDIEITFKEGWLQKRDIKSVIVDFDEQWLRIEIKGVPLMDAQLFGRIRPRECSWSLGDGILQAILAKADKTHWPSLTASQ